MKAAKIIGFGVLILGLLVYGDYELHAKASNSGQIAMNETSGVEIEKADHSQESQPYSITSATNAQTDSKTATNSSWFKIPGVIWWNNTEYLIDNKKTIHSLGKEIGIGKDTRTIPANYPIYEIPGIDSSQAVAIDVHQVYFEAFHQK